MDFTGISSLVIMKLVVFNILSYILNFTRLLKSTAEMYIFTCVVCRVRFVYNFCEMIAVMYPCFLVICFIIVAFNVCRNNLNIVIYEIRLKSVLAVFVLNSSKHRITNTPNQHGLELLPPLP